MRKLIIPASLILGLTLTAPTAKADAELDALIREGNAIATELDENTAELDKLNKKTVIPAATIEDIAKPNKPDEKPNPEKPSDDEKPEEKPSEDEKKPSTPSKEDQKEDSKNQSNKDEKADENKKEEKTSNGKDTNPIKTSKAKEKKTEDGKGKAPQTQNKNVQTGVESLNLVATTLIASIGSYLHIKKNK